MWSMDFLCVNHEDGSNINILRAVFIKDMGFLGGISPFMGTVMGAVGSHSDKRGRTTGLDLSIMGSDKSLNKTCSLSTVVEASHSPTL